MKHPATFSMRFIPIFAELLKHSSSVLDPFAGTGKIALIKEFGWRGKIVCNELESEWADSSYPVDEWHFTDAANMDWAEDNTFDAICTSPTYGNRMADHHNAKDGSKRVTYRHCMGRELTQGNTGMMQWGKDYRIKHLEAYIECSRVLRPNGLLIINVSDHIRKGQIVKVSGWHRLTLDHLGFSLVQEIAVQTRRMRYGENSRLRVEEERIFIFKNTSRNSLRGLLVSRFSD